MHTQALRMSIIKKGIIAGKKGFTLAEVLMVMSIIGIISAISLPVFYYLYCSCCLKAAVYELCDMIKEAKHNALCNGTYYSITFNTASGVISLVSDRGEDETWNTPDDRVVRAFRLSDKGGGLRFGHGSYGPLKIDGKYLAEAPDGVSFPTNNTCVCNPELTGNAGVAYIMSAAGSAMAVKMNSTDYGYAIYRWDGKGWARM